MRFYFVRHGESTANLLMEFSNNNSQHPLTERGVEQAQTLAHSLAGLDFVRIYASPVLRAAQTARILADSLGAPLEFTEALREWSVGIYEGTRNPLGWQKHRQVQEDWFIHNHPDSRLPGGESLLDIRARFVPFIESLVKAERLSGQHAGRVIGQDVLLVAHGGLYLAMLPALMDNIDYSFAHRQGFPHTVCTIAEPLPGEPFGLHCLIWCGQPPPSEPSKG
jgi:broad specificity phosphatase PhoE